MVNQKLMECMTMTMAKITARKAIVCSHMLVNRKILKSLPCDYIKSIGSKSYAIFSFLLYSLLLLLHNQMRLGCRISLGNNLYIVNTINIGKRWYI